MVTHLCLSRLGMHKLACCGCLVSALALGVGAIPACADTIDPVSYAVIANAVPAEAVCLTQTCTPSVTAIVPLDDDVTEDGELVNPYSGSAGAAVSLSPSPAVIATAAISSQALEPDSSAEGYVMYAGSAELTYYFELTAVPGTTAAGSIPVLMSGSVSLMASSGTTDDFTQSIVSMSVTPVDGTAIYNPTSLTSGGINQTLQITPGQEYEVEMGATAEAQVGAIIGSDETETASASLDPTFTVAGSCGCSNDYQFEFSPGIGNTPSTVPEPSSLVMAGGLLGLLSVEYFRRRRSFRR